MDRVEQGERVERAEPGREFAEEDQLEVSGEFKAKIRRAKQEIADGVYSRARKPEAGQ